MKKSESENLYTRPAFHDPKMPYMSMEARAAQFMPFKPLGRGHDFGQDDGDGDEVGAEK